MLRKRSALSRLGLPRRAALNHSVCKNQQLACAGHQRADRLFAVGNHAFIQCHTCGIAHTPDGSPALLASAGLAEPIKLSSTGRVCSIAQAEIRSGLIEIELANGTRLRVDAFVNELALHRVLSVLKASS